MTRAHSIFTVLTKMEEASAASAVKAFAPVLNRIEAQKRLSITYDQGGEMVGRQQLVAKTGIKVYFADPHSSWQRGRNKNTSGLTRPYLPKGATGRVLTGGTGCNCEETEHTSQVNWIQMSGRVLHVGHF